MGFTPSDNYCHMRSSTSTKIYRAACLLLCLLCAFRAGAQSLDVTFSLKDTQPSGQQILDAIREQTSFRFTYNGEVSKRLAGNVKTGSKQLRVKEALELLQRTLRIGAEANGNYIVLNLLPDVPNAAQEMPGGRLSGLVTEAGSGQAAARRVRTTVAAEERDDDQRRRAFPVR